MTAESIKKKQITQQPRTKHPTELQQKIIEINQSHPTLNKNEIAAVAGCDHAHVVRTLQTYGLIKKDVDNYISNRAAIFAGMQHRLINSLTEEDIKKTPVGSRVLAVAQLYDKERLERNQSTANIALHGISPEMQELYDKIIGRAKVEGDVIDVTPEARDEE
jgi:hypothetical protein